MRLRLWLPQSPQPPRPARPQPATRAERGQGLVIIAMATVGLLAFIGLMVDAGILFIGVGHLRRAVDAAALAASSQFREARTYDQIKASAREVIHLNGVAPTDLHLWWCNPGNGPGDPLAEPHDPALCAAPGAPQRKLVRVEATTRVSFAFLTIIGFHGTDIVAGATSEAASVDVVLAIDTSDSMAFDASCTDGDDDDGDGIADNCDNPPAHPPLVGAFADAPQESAACRDGLDSDGDTTLPISDPLYAQYADDGCPEAPLDSAECHDGLDQDLDGIPDDGCNDDYFRDPATCNLQDLGAADGFVGECHPFEEVKLAAASFVNRLYFPFDRVALVTYDINGHLVMPITNTLTPEQREQTVRDLWVSPKRVPPTYPGHIAGCLSLVPGENVSGCTNTSIGGGLKVAGNEFGRVPIRRESVWVVILLTDGAANASEPASGGVLNAFCPPSTWFLPFCRDASVDTRHTVITPTIWAPGHTAPYNPESSFNAGNRYQYYDADDFARDMADFVACAPKIADAAEWCKDSLNYTADEGGQGALIYAIGLGQLVIQNSVGDPNAGDDLLRYIANVGIDGDPNPNPPPPGVTDPCEGTPRVPTPVLTPGNDSYNCGNYYFAEFGTGLSSVFESIASRIFTRLTQ
jgi:hypothetical protein